MGLSHHLKFTRESSWKKGVCNSHCVCSFFIRCKSLRLMLCCFSLTHRMEMPLCTSLLHSDAKEWPRSWFVLEPLAISETTWVDSLLSRENCIISITESFSFQLWVRNESNLSQIWVKSESNLSQIWVRLKSELSLKWVKSESEISQILVRLKSELS